MKVNRDFIMVGVSLVLLGVSGVALASPSKTPEVKLTKVTPDAVQTQPIPQTAVATPQTDSQQPTQSQPQTAPAAATPSFCTPEDQAQIDKYRTGLTQWKAWKQSLGQNDDETINGNGQGNQLYHAIQALQQKGCT